MAAEGEFSKADGDLLYASEANDFYNYPKLLLSSTSATETFTPTKSDSRVIIWVKGTMFLGGGATAINVDVDLDVASVTKDTVKLQQHRAPGGGNSNMAFSLIWTDVDLATSSTDIDITTSEGVLENIKIIVMEYTKE